MNEKRMSDAEIVAELLASYKHGSTGIYHNNWFMVKIEDNVREELDRRLSEADNLPQSPSDTLNVYELWMVKSNMNRIKTEGVDAVVARLHNNGYSRVAEAVRQRNLPQSP